jgi:hypothetical protein
VALGAVDSFTYTKLEFHLQEIRSAYKILVRKPEGKKSVGRYSRRTEDDNKVDLEERGY